MERLGLPKNFCRAVEQGTIKSEDYEHGAMVFRYLAGSLGLPFIPTKSLLGSDILTCLDEKNYSVMASPFSGEKVVLLSPCRPDVAVIHVPRADEQGNCQIDGTTLISAEIPRLRWFPLFGSTQSFIARGVHTLRLCPAITTMTMRP
jgi:acyl CoA:acetate/3-ketoacid CoA transferase alpha subunit